ncbi:MAG: hypothetical protein ACI9CA_001577 [Natronomonas sp.]|jgi:hypothetical protein
MGLGPMCPHLWLKDEIARELLEETDDDRRSDRRRRLPDGRRESDDPSFLTDGETDHEVLTGDAGQE